MTTEVSGAYSTSRADLSRWSESLSLVNKATMRNVDRFSRTGFDRPPRPKTGSLSNVPSVLDNKEDNLSRGTMYNNYLGNHSVLDTLATLDKLQNSQIARSLSPNRGSRAFSNDVYFQQQTNRQRQPFSSNGGLIRPAEDFFFNNRSNSVGRPRPEKMHDELEMKTSLDRAKDDLELFSRELQNSLKKSAPTYQSEDYKDKLDNLTTQLPSILDEINFKINELIKKTSLTQKQNTNLFERTIHFVSDETLRIANERQKHEILEKLNPLEKHVRDLLVQLDNVKYEVDNKLAEKLNKLQVHKTDSASEILQLKNDLYGFVDNKLTHHSTIMEKRVDTLNAFCNEQDMRLKRLIGYKDEIEMKLEDQQSLVSQKLINLNKLEQKIESRVIEMRRYHMEALNKMNTFEIAQETLTQEVETQLEFMKSQKHQESQLKKIVLDVIAPRDKIERENIKKYNKVFKSLDSKINTVLNNQQNLKKEIDHNQMHLSSVEAKVLTTFQQQIEEMKSLRSEPSPQKSLPLDSKFETRIQEIEQRVLEKANQTISMFDSSRENIEHNRTNLENLATLYSSLIDKHKKLHTAVAANEVECKKAADTCSGKLEQLQSQFQEVAKTNDIVASFEQAEHHQHILSQEFGLKYLGVEKRQIPLEVSDASVQQADDKDEEVVFDTEVNQKAEAKDEVKEEGPSDVKEDTKEEVKKTPTAIKSNFNLIDDLPDLESSGSLQDGFSDEIINDNSLDMLSGNSPRPEPLEDDELEPLPSKSPSSREENEVPKFEQVKSIDQIRQEKKKEKPKPKPSLIVEPKSSKITPAYSFLGLGGGGRVNKPKKPKIEFPKMRRDEFLSKTQFQKIKEGDDYYYSLKENQFCIGDRVFEREAINSIKISERERKEKIYNQKYISNLEQFDEYMFITNQLTKFTLEYEVDGATGEEEEAIIIEDSLTSNELIDQSLTINSISEPEKSNLGEKVQSEVDNYKSSKTFFLSEDDKSQVTSQSRRNSYLFQKEKQNPIIENFQVDEEEEDEDEGEESVNIISPKSRFHYNEKKLSSDYEKASKSISSQHSLGLKSLSRKPKNKLVKNNSAADSKYLRDAIEMSDYESSGASFGAYYLSKASEGKSNTVSPTKPIQQESKPTLNRINTEQKEQLVKSVAFDWVNHEIETSVARLHPNIKFDT